jgi:uncharacterized metal-binding protein
MAITAFVVYSWFVMKMNLDFIKFVAMGAVISAFFFNPDTFTPSASQNYWGPLKIVFRNRFWAFAHHGISHNPLLWGTFELIACAYVNYANGDITVLYFVTGLVGCATLHLICDFVSIMLLPIRKILGWV